MTRGTYAILFVVLLPSCVGAGTSRYDLSQATPLWGRWEGAFDAFNPPAEVVFRAVFTAPSGRVTETPGFWDGGVTWRVRFMPDEEGLWTYETQSFPGTAGLHGRRGTFVCFSSRRTDNPFLSRGPIQVAPGGPFFQHVDGTPFLWIGDTAWNGPLHSSRVEWQAYLSDRAARGFSAVQFVTTQWRAARRDREGHAAYSGFEEININPAFFQRLDARIDAINRAGLLAAPVLLWALGEPREVPGRLPESQALRLARYMVARYGAHHVAWILGGDGDYGGDAADRWMRIGRAVFGGGVRAPVFLHPAGMQWPWEAFQSEPWLTALAYQSGHGDDEATLKWTHSGPPARTWSDYPGRPVINLEPAYEDIRAYHSGRPHSAFSVRRAIYWSLLSTPTSGVSYGAHGVWNWESVPGVPMNHPNSGIARPWYEAVSFEGADDVRHLATLFTSLPWWRLLPDPSLILRADTSSAAFVSASRSPDGSSAVIYMPRGGPVLVDHERLSGRVEASWFNPREGRRSSASPTRSGPYVAPDTLDWVLYFRPRPD